MDMLYKYTGMEVYKPGQVSALLFSSNASSSKNENSALMSLFTPSKMKKSKKKSSNAELQQRTVAQNGISKASKNDTPKLRKEIFKEKIKEGKKKLNSRKSNGTVENVQTPETKKGASEINNLHETLVNKSVASKTKAPKKAQETPKKIGIKRKLDQEDEQDEVRHQKRQRRNRQRDKQADRRTIFIGNCPLSADKKTLKTLFKEYGEIETLRVRCAPAADPNLPRRAIVITKNFHEHCKSYVAYIVFRNEESAQKSLVRNGHLLNGLHLRVDIAANSHKHDKKRSIFVGNLPFTITEEEIRSHFNDCGDIKNVRIVRDRKTSLGKGICYVQFESKDSVSLALKLNSWEIQGRKARVMPCTSKAKLEEAKAKGSKRSKQSNEAKSKTKKISFAPSNATTSTFQKKLQAKKEKRMKKKDKLKKSFKKGDGLSAIFGDTPAGIASKKKGSQKKAKKNTALGGGGKSNKSFKSLGGGKGKPRPGSNKGSKFKTPKGHIRQKR